MHPIVEGFLLAGFLMFFVGPSFFYLISVGIEHGFKKGVSFALGIILSDLLLIVIIYNGLSFLFENLLFQEIFSLLAGITIFVLGYRYLNKSAKKPSLVKVKKETAPDFIYTIKGFAINLINPFTGLLWIAILGTISMEKNFEGNDYIMFFSSLALFIFIFDILKAYLANKLGQILNEKLIRRINRVLGIVFFIVSIRLFYFAYTLWVENAV
ncbi:LysE family translocator [Flexithrix dorotheae]|uniref:LysE family translocator n=1 Tax=Flexithrix dorotheae TaxID=70993 RepID=UPI00039F50D1|nr:LysE family transporter [Flexithrix dorotheae]